MNRLLQFYSSFLFIYLSIYLSLSCCIFIFLFLYVFSHYNFNYYLFYSYFIYINRKTTTTTTINKLIKHIIKNHPLKYSFLFFLCSKNNYIHLLLLYSIWNNILLTCNYIIYISYTFLTKSNIFFFFYFEHKNFIFKNKYNKE
jgi:hypothetical protein